MPTKPDPDRLFAGGSLQRTGVSGDTAELVIWVAVLVTSLLALGYFST